jgi:N-methylhydantoinase A
VANFRVAVDVGGTFTDIVVLDESGELSVGKVPSTLHPDDGVLAAIEKMAVPLKEAVFFSHGTTVATNALITRRLPRTAMVTTRGFRDVIEIRRGTKDDLWDAYRDVAPPYIRRRDRYVVTERIGFDGRVVEPLDDAEVRTLAESLKGELYEAIAICFINAYANGSHERQAQEIFQEILPNVMISSSSDVLPELFEHERFSTTVVNATLGPLVNAYVDRLEERLRNRDYKGDLLVLHSGGGVMTPGAARRLAARIAGSGIAAGAIASRHVAGLCGYPNAIGLDMGGTSTDVSVAHEGKIRVTKDWFIEYGYPICFPTVEVRTIGAGGGSIGWIDEAGSLRNGPQSAGSTPGPASYGLGGSLPTNTDANLVLDRLGDALLGGEMHLRRDLAASVIDETIGKVLGLETAEAAAAMIQVANANMADAVRLTSIRRGYDPRDFALVVFGGAGPLHGAALARDLSIPLVIVPPHPGITSALGCLLVDVRHDLSAMFLSRVADADATDVEATFKELESQAHERLATEGIHEGDMDFGRTIDMRYYGQWRSIAVPVSTPLASLDDALTTFHDLHEREHTFRRDNSPVEMYRLNVTAIGVTRKAEFAVARRNGHAFEAKEIRQVYFEETDGRAETPVYDRVTLGSGTSVSGPAIIEQLDSTVVIPPNVDATIDDWLNIRIKTGDFAT